jgi:hypothetical protein
VRYLFAMQVDNLQNPDILCLTLASSIKRLQNCLRSSTNIRDLLDGFWGVRDIFGRFLQFASDHPHEAFDTLKETAPRLIQEAVAVLRDAGQRHLDENAAVKECIEEINVILSNLLMLKPSRQGEPN